LRLRLRIGHPALEVQVMNGHETSSQKTNGTMEELRHLSSVLHEIKDETKDFVQTRFTLLKSELQEKLPNLKIAAVLAAVGALFAVTAYALLTLALVCLVAVAFKGSDFQWTFAFLCVGVLWLLIGGAALYMAKRELALRGLMPKRTFEVLKGDKIWLEHETRNQYERVA
jgi:uncharacterized membrane protein YqjE